MSEAVEAYRASILHYLRDPASSPSGADPTYEYFADGLLVVRDGHVVELGDASDVRTRLPAGARELDLSDKLIVPGFVDTHVHYVQTDAIASYGTRLLEWLERHTYPVEARFGDAGHAAEVARVFLAELLRNGTTSALVMGSVHQQSADALFEAAHERNLRLVAGKVLMDRNCPPDLRDTARTGIDDSRELIERWHGVDRLHYAITPRFAPTSSDEQLAAAGRLVAEYPDVYVHTHLAESREELAWVAELFPKRESYLDVYDHHGLVRERAVFAHCIHLGDRDRQRLASAGAAMAFCPTSNLFLGSGLFDLDAADRHAVRVGIGTDVGGGTSFSMLRTLDESYKVAQLGGWSLDPHRAMYLATLGGARSLYLDARIGNFLPGKEADFVVLDPSATPLLRRRMDQSPVLEQMLFALMLLGDDRCVWSTYVMARLAHHRDEPAAA